MDGSRSGPLSDDELLDRALEAALDVDPSPEFVARVRLRVAGEPRAASWGGPWRAAAAGGAVAACVLLAVWLWPLERVADPFGAGSRQRPVQTAVVEHPQSLPRSEDPSPQPASAAARGAGNAGAYRRPAASSQRSAVMVEAERGAAPAPPDFRPLPEVRVSAEEVRAYQMLFANVPVQPVTVVGEDPTVPAQSAELHDLALTPLIIEPRPQIARLETGEPQ
jgi:hypothetical protein